MIRIGIVGCGRILAAHLRGYRLLREAGIDDFRITALCARQRSDAEMYVKRGVGPAQRAPVSRLEGDPLAIGDEYLSDFQNDVDVAIYTDYRAMIADGPIDAVNDFTTHSLHHQVANHAFEHGKDLLTQKPLAVTVEAARRMCAAAEAKDRIFGVFENFHTLPETRYLAWLFETGQIGLLQMILHGYVGLWWAPDQIVAETPWRHRMAEGGGITLDLGVHFLNQMRYLAGSPQSVQGSVATLEPVRHRRDEDGKTIERIDCDADDTCEAVFEFSNGVRASLIASWAGHGGPTLLGAGSTYYGSAGKVAAGQVYFPDASMTSLEAMYWSEAPRQRQSEDFPLGLRDSFALAQLDWLDAVRKHREPATSGKEGLIDLAWTYAILESDLAGRRVDVGEVLRGDLREYQRPIDARYGLLP